MEPMIFVEPASAFSARLRIPSPLLFTTAAAQPTPQEPIAPGRLPSDDFWSELILDTLRQNDNVPMRITSVVNVVVAKGGYSTNADRVEKKRMLFKLIGRLIRTCRLDRYERKSVVIPTTDARRLAYMAKASITVELPPPCV